MVPGHGQLALVAAEQVMRLQPGQVPHQLPVRQAQHLHIVCS